MPDEPKDMDEELRKFAPRGIVYRSTQDEVVEGLMITVGAMERSIADMEKRTEEVLERLEAKLDEVTKKIDDNNLMVKVTSNGIAAQVRLNDIIQFFMDRPSTQMKKVESTISRIVDSARDIVWIFGAITAIIYAMDAVLKFARP